jgi:inosose dehydratase
MSLRRRELLAGAAAAVATGALGGCGRDGLSGAPAARRLAVGHTGITWGYGGANAEQAIADVAGLGFHGFESFGSVIEYWETRGGIGALLDAAGLPLVGAYCPMVLADPAVRDAEIAKITRWGGLISKYGGRIAVIGPDNVDRERFDFAASRRDIVTTLDAIGRAVSGLGLVAALHQHTGSCITTLDETDAVLAEVDTRLVQLCPDTGELLNAGIDPAAFIEDHIDLVAHVHIKDFNGGARNDGYCPVGTGRVDVAAVIDTLEANAVDCMVMAELNPDQGFRSGAPGDLALQNRAKFVELGYRFRG